MKKHTCIAEAHEILNDLNIAPLASDEQRRATLPDSRDYASPVPRFYAFQSAQTFIRGNVES